MSGIMAATLFVVFWVTAVHPLPCWKKTLRIWGKPLKKFPSSTTEG